MTIICSARKYWSYNRSTCFIYSLYKQVWPSSKPHNYRPREAVWIWFVQKHWCDIGLERLRTTVYRPSSNGRTFTSPTERMQQIVGHRSGRLGAKTWRQLRRRCTDQFYVLQGYFLHRDNIQQMWKHRTVSLTYDSILTAYDPWKPSLTGVVCTLFFLKITKFLWAPIFRRVPSTHLLPVIHQEDTTVVLSVQEQDVTE